MRWRFYRGDDEEEYRKHIVRFYIYRSLGGLIAMGLLMLLFFIINSCSPQQKRYEAYQEWYRYASSAERQMGAQWDNAFNNADLPGRVELCRYPFLLGQTPDREQVFLTEEEQLDEIIKLARIFRSEVVMFKETESVPVMADAYVIEVDIYADDGQMLFRLHVCQDGRAVVIVRDSTGDTEDVIFKLDIENEVFQPLNDLFEEITGE